MLYRYDQHIALASFFFFFCKTRESLNSLVLQNDFTDFKLHVHVYEKIVFEQFLDLEESREVKL